MKNQLKLQKLLFSLVLFSFLMILASNVATAQADDPAATMAKGIALFSAERYAEAVPLLEKSVASKPDDPDLRIIYGISLMFGAKQVSDIAVAKKMSADALKQFQEAKKLGSTEPELDTFIAFLGSDGSSIIATQSAAGVRESSPAEKFMAQAESLFAQSKYDEAIVFYEKALAADAKLYNAALYLGDCYTMKEDWAKAELYYQKAIAIDPTRETGYRYSGTPLMKQKKYDQALERYIEALITEPYNSYSARGISQWADATGAKLGHPKTDIPKVAFDAAGKATATMNDRTLTEGSKAWVVYTQTRQAWFKEKFAATNPTAKAYRHSLAEEVESIRATLRSAKELKISHPDLVLLQKLDDEGLLESFILMAIPDEGIASDHPNYLKDNRLKLRKYVRDYVIKK